MQYTLCLQKCASCSFNKNKLIFRNDMHIQLSFSLHFYLFYLLLNSCNGNDTKSLLNALNAFCTVSWHSPNKSVYKSVAVSKHWINYFRWARSKTWQQILPWSSAEEADAASHALHCWQQVCVPARQCTCAACSRNSPAPSAGNTGFYLSRSVTTKQSGPKPG